MEVDVPITLGTGKDVTADDDGGGTVDMAVPSTVVAVVPKTVEFMPLFLLVPAGVVLQSSLP